MLDAILVTGATGFVGSHLVAALREQGRSVATHSSADGDIARCTLEFDDVARVVHLAGRSFVPDSWMSPRPFYDVNVLGTVNVLEFCRSRQVPLTYVSSYVYGRPVRLPIHEDHPLEPLNPYSHSKMLAEDAVRYFAAQFAVRTTIVRPFNIYGPRQNERFLIPAIIGQALDPDTDCITLRDLRPRRDFIHVRDLVSLLCATLDRPAGGVYNAGSGRSVGIAELVAVVNGHVAHPKPLRSTGDERRDEVLDVVADVTRAKRELSWEPRVSLSDGLRETVEWTRTQLAPAR